MKILKWLKKLFRRKPAIQIVVNDNLTSLEGVKITCEGKPIIDFEEVQKPRINSMGEEVTKTITRTIIQFVRNKDEYQVLLLMQGHEFVIDRWYLMSDSLPLMTIKKNERRDLVKKFMDYGYDIDVQETK